MKEICSSNFGLIIAFLLPGFTALWGATYISPVMRSWLTGAKGTGPTVAGLLYVTLASVAAGLTVSIVRWAVIDTLHHWTGLPKPTWDFSRLQQRFAAYKMLHEIHYKFYQAHSNLLVALSFVYLARRAHFGFFTAALGWFDVAFFILCVILYTGSRDTLRNFYTRVNHLLGSEPPRKTNEPDTVSMASDDGSSSTARRCLGCDSRKGREKPLARPRDLLPGSAR